MLWPRVSLLDKNVTDSFFSPDETSGASSDAWILKTFDLQNNLRSYLTSGKAIILLPVSGRVIVREYLTADFTKQISHEATAVGFEAVIYEP